MDDSDEKRVVHPTLKKILTRDMKITKYIVQQIPNYTITRSIRNHCQLFEILGHGIIWLAVTIGSVWVLAMPSLYELQMNLLLALFLDIIVVALIKAATRRRRPTVSTGMGPDKFSFPSGHASRVAMIVYILIFLHPVYFIFFPSLIVWLSLTSASRVLSQKHYLLDVISGIVLGIIEGMFIGLIWMGPETSLYLVQWISDEKIPGAEYDV